MASLKKRTLKSGDTYYLQHYVGGKRQKLINLHTDSVEIAEEEQRSFESAEFRGAPNPFPSETTPAKILSEYVKDIRTRRPKKSVQNEICYLRDIFGSCCDELKITSRKLAQQRKSRPAKSPEDGRCTPLVLKPQFIEHIRTSDISRLIQSRVESRGLAPKTANHYRAILRQLLNWAVKEREVRLPGGLNPANNVKPYSERAPIIVFLEVEQIDKQIESLNDLPQLQAAVATYIYAGLRREELLWLTHKDISWKAPPYGTICIRAKTIDGEFWQAKCRKNRVIPISSDLRPFLDKQRLRASQSIWLFPNSVGGRYDPDNLSSDLRQANEAAKLPWTCLHFRHTFASQMAMVGVPFGEIARLMGNSPAIVERHYAGVSAARLVHAVEFRKPPANGRAEAVASISA